MAVDGTGVGFEKCVRREPATIIGRAAGGLARGDICILTWFLLDVAVVGEYPVRAQRSRSHVRRVSWTGNYVRGERIRYQDSFPGGLLNERTT